MLGKVEVASRHFVNFPKVYRDLIDTKTRSFQTKKTTHVKIQPVLIILECPYLGYCQSGRRKISLSQMRDDNTTGITSQDCLHTCGRGYAARMSRID